MRFREDANAEEDAALGGYRDRLVVELAQNAVDAAALAGVPGRLLLRLDPGAGVLLAANDGAPLDAAGVLALSTLRASAKRSGASVGRFGVGFAAVLAVGDAPEMHSRTGSVGWSRERVADAVAMVPSLAAEVDRRRGAVPVLRLPFVIDRSPDAGALLDAGWDTVVRLPLRSPAAVAQAATLLHSVDPSMLLVLPGLEALTIEQSTECRELTCRRSAGVVELTDGARASRWREETASGRLDPALLADRPVEEQSLVDWTVRALVRVDGQDAPVALPESVPAVLRAPQPTDEPLSLPLVLSVPVPLDPTRRHVAPGPLRDSLLRSAARVVADLMSSLPAVPPLLDLVPTGLAAGVSDGVLRAELAAVLPEAPLLAGAAGERLRGRDAVVLDLGRATEPATEVLADVLPGLLAPAYGGPGRRAALQALGVRRLGTADLVEALRGLQREPSWWGRLYPALLDADDRDALAGLPVPLADGRTVGSPRGVLLPGEGVDVGALLAAGLPLRVVHPAAAVPALLRLGAVVGTPRALLADPAVVGGVETADPSAFAEAVLGLVAAAGATASELPWLTELPLPAADADWRPAAEPDLRPAAEPDWRPAAEPDWRPAAELLLPGGLLDRLVAPDSPFGRVAPDLVERWGGDVLRAVGVLDGFALLRDEAVPVDPGSDDLPDLDSVDDWCEAVLDALPDTGGPPPVVAELVAVRDLELVAPGSWRAALSALAAADLRAAVLTPARVLTDGGPHDVPSYTAWWLATHPVLDGSIPTETVLAGTTVLSGLYDEVGSDVDEAFLRALGCRVSLDAVLADEEATLDLLDRLGDASRSPSRDQCRTLYAAAGRALAGRDVDPPLTVRAVARDGRLVVVAGAEAVVVDRPDLLPLVGARPVVPAPLPASADVAEVVAAPLATGLAAFPLESAGRREPVPAVVRALLGEEVPQWWHWHDRLRVRDVDGTVVPVAWTVRDGMPHADGPDGLGRALAWLAGQWSARADVAAVLHDATRLPHVLAERDLDG